MTELHPGDDRLLSLALDDIGDPERAVLLEHLARCASCRSEYDGLSAAIEQTLAAAPSVPPPIGFEERVLDAMGFGQEPTDRLHVGTRRRAARWGLVAASLVLGAGLGAGVTYQVAHEEAATPPAVTAEDQVLTTPAGERVGSVAHSYFDGSPVVVISVTHGRPDMTYLCRARLGDGSTVKLGEWTVDANRHGTWVVQPPGNASSLELVANGGAGPVWSRADL